MTNHLLEVYLIEKHINKFIGVMSILIIVAIVNFNLFIYAQSNSEQEALYMYYGFLQAWNEEIQSGINRLNAQPETEGVTSINGVLLLSQSELMVPGRLGSLPVIRYYNSKLWSARTIYAYGGDLVDSLKLTGILGMGWDLHFGRLIQNGYGSNGGYLFETQDGNCIYFNYKCSGLYISTDGQFMKLFLNSSGTMKIYPGDGSELIFDNYVSYGNYSAWYLTKSIDRHGNITEIFYSGWEGMDSLRTSTKEKVTFKYHVPANSQWAVLDTIRYSTVGATTVDIIYKYDTTASTTQSPFGSTSQKNANLLRMVIYPNNDTIRYHYNQYFELDSIYYPNGGIVSYVYGTYTYYTPDLGMLPPGSTNTVAWMHKTREIKKAMVYDPWTSPNTDSTIYNRCFSDPSHAKSNPDSIITIDPLGNYTINLYNASYSPSRSDIVWVWTNGKPLSEITYDNNENLITRTIYGTKNITSDSIGVVTSMRKYDGRKTYMTSYHEYDNYGNVGLTHNWGDSTRSDDDSWIHCQYKTNDTTAWVKIGFYNQGPGINYYTRDTFYATIGVDSLRIQRTWYYYSSTALDSTTTYHYIPASNLVHESEKITDVYPPFDKVRVITTGFYSTLQLTDTIIWDIDYNPYPPAPETKYVQDYAVSKYNFHLPSEKRITDDTVGTILYKKECYTYDDTGYIVKTYADSLVQWTDPSRLRGSLTKKEILKYGNEYTTQEFRYDQVGNIVQTISHPDDYTAETSFVYYDPTDTVFKYNYAYPWRTVGHVSSGACSLTTRS
jgi:hypothetical protein